MKRMILTGVFSLMCIFMFGACGGNKAQTADYTLYATDEDKAIYERFMSEMLPKKDIPLNDLIIETGRFFLGTPYVGKTLEQVPEGLVVNLRELDCTTFVETVFTLVRTLRSEDTSFDNYCNNLQELRYRESKVGSYIDRLHYTTDWIYENEKKGILKDVTKAIGGVENPLQLNFMSTHPDSYPQLKDEPEYVSFMENKEKEINSRSYYFIPEADIDNLGSGMKSGDMVCFVTTVGGLDLSHVGIIYWYNGTLTFMHASSTAKEVIINPESLSAYVERVKSNKGVMVVRLQENH